MNAGIGDERGRVYWEIGAHVGVVIARRELGGVGGVLVEPMHASNFRRQLPSLKLGQGLRHRVTKLGLMMSY